MKKRIVVFIFILISLGLFSFVMLKKAGKAGYTGSPGESTCTSCHNSFALNSSNGSISFSSNIPGDSYTPDSTYQLKLVVRKPGLSLFGFGLEALKSGNTSTGAWTVTDATRTQILTAANGRKNMVHKLNGGAFPDSAVFSCNWKAPSTNVGTITFYYTGVCANNNNADNLDYVYKGNHSITSTSTIGIEQIDQPYSDLEVTSFSPGQFVNVSFLLDKNADVQLSLLLIDGKLVKTTQYSDQYPGEKLYTLYTSDFQSGVYILVAQINEVSVTRKFLLIQ